MGVSGQKIATGIIILLATLAIGVVIFSQLSYHAEGTGALSASDSLTINSTAATTYSLTHDYVVIGSYKVYSGSTVYEEGKDYTLDRETGTLTVVSGGALDVGPNTVDVTVDYKYLEDGNQWNYIESGRSMGFNSLRLVEIGAVVLGAVFVLSLLGLLGGKGGGPI